MKKYLSFTFLLAVLLAASCKKFDFSYPVTGEAVGTFQLSTPADNNELMLNSATPAAGIVFNWSAAAKGVDAPVTYTWKLDLATGDFSNPIWQVASDNGGTATQVTLTNKSIDSLLAAKSVAANARAVLKWTVAATNSSGTVQTAAPFKVNITRFGTGISAFTIFAPAPATAVSINPGSTADFFNFKWQKAVASPSGNTIKYKVVFVQKQYDGTGTIALTPNFATPLFSIASNNSGADTLGDYSYKQISDSLTAHGIPVSQAAQLQWTVIATAAAFSQQALYYNDLTIVREVKYYLVGDATQGGWNNPVPTPSQELKQIDANSFGGVYNLNGGGQYLVLPKNGDWSAKFGNACGSDGCNNPAGAAFIANGNNFAGPATAGWYKMLFNFQTSTFTVAPTETPFSGTAPTDLFIVGGATPGGWNNPVSVPSQQFTKLGAGVFQLTINLAAGDSYLLLPVNGSWDHKFGGTSKTFGSILADNDVPGSNTPSPDVAGTYQITVDFVHGYYAVVKQ